MKQKFDRKLANWVQNQRIFSETGVLLPERRKKLDQVGFIWRGGKTSAVANRNTGNAQNTGSEMEFESESDGDSSSVVSETSQHFPQRKQPPRTKKLPAVKVAASTEGRNRYSSSDSELEL